MEAFYKNLKFTTKNLMITLIFMGIIMLVVSFYLPYDQNNEIKETLKNLGIITIIIPFVVIIALYIKKEML